LIGNSIDALIAVCESERNKEIEGENLGKDQTICHQTGKESFYQDSEITPLHRGVVNFFFGHFYESGMFIRCKRRFESRLSGNTPIRRENFHQGELSSESAGANMPSNAMRKSFNLKSVVALLKCGWSLQLALTLSHRSVRYILELQTQ